VKGERGGGTGRNGKSALIKNDESELVMMMIS
jgi:hypothetical protein